MNCPLDKTDIGFSRPRPMSLPIAHLTIVLALVGSVFIGVGGWHLFYWVLS